MTKHVYFFEAQGLNLVKIGCSCRPMDRLKAYMDISPVHLDLVAYAPGNEAVEKDVHQRFASARSHHEWFEFTPEIRSLVREIGLNGKFPEQYDLIPEIESYAKQYEQRFKQLSKERGWTPEFIADFCGVALSTAKQWQSIYFQHINTPHIARLIRHEKESGRPIEPTDFFMKYERSWASKYQSDQREKGTPVSWRGAHEELKRLPDISLTEHLKERERAA